MTNPSTATMRAIRQDTHGSPEVLREVEPPRPEPGSSEILIAVRAAGVNPTDWWNRAQPMSVTGLPLILGWDVSGVVEAVGTGVTIFKPGDEVFGMLPYPHGVGAHAEYVTAPARAFVHKPADIDHIQAGALPLAALTAYQALVDTADIQPGQRVFIHAAVGGVGHLAVQIAKSRGAYVIGTASAAKHDFLRSLGVDEAIDYHSVDFTEAVKDIDVVLDPISLDTAARARSLAVLRPGGTLAEAPRRQTEHGPARLELVRPLVNSRFQRRLPGERSGEPAGDRGANPSAKRPAAPYREQHDRYGCP